MRRKNLWYTSREDLRSKLFVIFAGLAFGLLPLIVIKLTFILEYWFPSYHGGKHLTSLLKSGGVKAILLIAIFYSFVIWIFGWAWIRWRLPKIVHKKAGDALKVVAEEKK